MNQLESTLEVLKDRSGDAVGAVQHGVEALGTRLGVIEPPRRRRKAPWLLLVLVAAVAGVVVVAGAQPPGDRGCRVRAGDRLGADLPQRLSRSSRSGGPLGAAVAGVVRSRGAPSRGARQ